MAKVVPKIHKIKFNVPALQSTILRKLIRKVKSGKESYKLDVIVEQITMLSYFPHHHRHHQNDCNHRHRQMIKIYYCNEIGNFSQGNCLVGLAEQWM